MAGIVQYPIVLQGNPMEITMLTASRGPRPDRTRLALLVALVAGMAADGPAAEPPRSLFNGRDFRGWSIYIQHKDKGIDPRADPKRVFEVRGSLIHVSGEEFGALTTDE